MIINSSPDALIPFIILCVFTINNEILHNHDTIIKNQEMNVDTLIPSNAQITLKFYQMPQNCPSDEQDLVWNHMFSSTALGFCLVHFVAVSRSFLDFHDLGTFEDNKMSLSLDLSDASS